MTDMRDVMQVPAVPSHLTGEALHLATLTTECTTAITMRLEQLGRTLEAILEELKGTRADGQKH